MILITGASSGIGAASARAFAKEGNELLLVARREDRLRALATQLHTEFRVPVHEYQLDVSDSHAVQKFVDEKGALLSEVTVLINNAGLAKGLSTFQEGDVKDWDVMMDTNVKGLLYVTRGVLPFFLRNKAGHIINVGSVAGRWVYPKGNIYCATKAAVAALTQTLRLDLAGTGIRVTEVSPGMVKTDFSLVRLEGDLDKAEAIYQGMTPLTGEDIAEAILWAVNRPSHVNIQEIVLFPTDQASTTMVSRKS